MLRLLVGSLAFCALALASTPTHAQTAVYAVGGITNYGFTDLHNNSNLSFKGDTGNVGGGVFYDFPIHSRVTVGVDAHVEGSPGLKGGVHAAGGLRIGFVPNRNPLRPFVQIGGGVIHSSYVQYYEAVNGFGSTSYAVTQPVTNGSISLVLGLDIRLSDHLDLRAPEYGADAGGSRGVRAGVGFLNAGLVYHLRPKPQH